MKAYDAESSKATDVRGTPLRLEREPGRQGVLVVGETGFSDAIVSAKNEAMLAELMKDFEVPAEVSTIQIP